MSDRFEWQFDVEDEGEEDVPFPHDNRPLFSGRLILGLIFFFVLLFGFLQVRRTRQEDSETALMRSLQIFLDLEHDAVLTGDGALFLRLQADDAAWISAQLLPENQAVMRAGLRVIQAEQDGEFIWANVTWAADGETLHRVVFFRDRDGRLFRTPTAPPDYWGEQWRTDQPWGALIYSGVDHEWTEEIAAFVTETIAKTCVSGCLEDQLPLILTLAKDYGKTAASGQLRLSSPRLLALDENGEPAPLFWQMLEERIVSYLTPATVRFAVPPAPRRGGRPVSDYEQAAADFSLLYPEITIELVELEEMPSDLAVLAADYDGAAIPPTEAMLTAGLVRDLTDYIHTDPIFDRSDYYGQIWEGTRWRERTWWLPGAASMRLLFYDKGAYRGANRPEPPLDWTWAEMTEDVGTLVPAQSERGDLSWGFLDTGLDTLFSYAYNWDNRCTEEATILCESRLQTQNVAAAFDWYSQMAGRPEKMPDLTGLPSFDRDNIIWNLQGARRQAAIWADLPAFYEHHLLLAPVGVVPFPGTDDFPGITPLWVHGGFVSQASERPLAVWRWLVFLSYQRPTLRLIPARPSVAEEMGFWKKLPPPLGAAMRKAFPFSRPVTIEEQAFLTWDQVSAVLSGGLAPTDAARQRTNVAWFGQD